MHRKGMLPKKYILWNSADEARIILKAIISEYKK